LQITLIDRRNCGKNACGALSDEAGSLITSGSLKI